MVCHPSLSFMSSYHYVPCFQCASSSKCIASSDFALFDESKASFKLDGSTISDYMLTLHTNEGSLRIEDGLISL